MQYRNKKLWKQQSLKVQSNTSLRKQLLYNYSNSTKINEPKTHFIIIFCLQAKMEHCNRPVHFRLDNACSQPFLQNSSQYCNMKSKEKRKIQKTLLTLYFEERMSLKLVKSKCSRHCIYTSLRCIASFAITVFLR